jgi:hypothetical protein
MDFFSRSPFVSFNQDFIFGEYNVNVCSDSPKSVDFSMKGPLGEVDALILALWLPTSNSEQTYYLQYSAGDYYEQTINARPPGKGLGPMLHDFIMTHRQDLPFMLNNLYSTKKDEDDYELLGPGKRLWEKRIAANKAIFNEQVGRFQILWEEV